MKELNLNLKQLKELRKALGLAIQEIDSIEEEERFEVISELYDTISNAEEELEEEI